MELTHLFWNDLRRNTQTLQSPASTLRKCHNGSNLGPALLVDCRSNSHTPFPERPSHHSRPCSTMRILESQFQALPYWDLILFPLILLFVTCTVVSDRHIECLPFPWTPTSSPTTVQPGPGPPSQPPCLEVLAFVVPTDQLWKLLLCGFFAARYHEETTPPSRLTEGSSSPKAPFSAASNTRGSQASAGWLPKCFVNINVRVVRVVRHCCGCLKLLVGGGVLCAFGKQRNKEHHQNKKKKATKSKNKGKRSQRLAWLKTMMANIFDLWKQPLQQSTTPTINRSNNQPATTSSQLIETMNGKSCYDLK